MDAFQIVMSLAIFVTMTFFVVLSVQLFFILKELRKTVGKVNEILGDVEDVSREIKSSVETVSNSVHKLTAMLDVVSFIKNKFHKDNG